MTQQAESADGAPHRRGAVSIRPLSNIFPTVLKGRKNILKTVLVVIYVSLNDINMGAGLQKEEKKKKSTPKGGGGIQRDRFTPVWMFEEN